MRLKGSNPSQVLNAAFFQSWSERTWRGYSGEETNIAMIAMGSAIIASQGNLRDASWTADYDTGFKRAGYAESIPC